MSIPAKVRNRVLGVSVLLTGALGFTWYNKTYRPQSEEIAALEAQVADQQRKNRDAQTTDLAVGADRAEAAIRTSRQEAAALSSRVPASSPDASSAQPFVEALSRAARNHGVRVHQTQPIAQATEAQFHVDGMRVQVTGRYHDVGALMTEMLSQPRLTQIRGVRIGVVPDSLMQAAMAPTAGGMGAATMAADTGFAIPQGEPPFTVYANFSLHWFSIAPPQPKPDSTSASSTTGETAAVPLESH